MYIVPELINLGLAEGESWTSEDHKNVAMNVCLCNDRVTTRDALMDMVKKINAIPQEEIRTVTIIDLAKKYKVPYLSLS